MRTVIIVGAGASLAQAISYRPTHTREHPPLDSNFFERATELREKHSDVAAAIALLTKAVGASRYFPNPFNGVAPGLEQFFADIYYEMMHSRSTKAFRVFVALLTLYNRVIGATTNWMATQRRLGVLDKLLRQQAKQSTDKLTLVTFNQDLVLENVISRLPRGQGKWCLKSLYGDPPLRQIWSPGKIFKKHDKACPHTPPVRLLKLHGSLNWVLRTRDKDPTLSTLFPTKEKRIFLARRRVAESGLRLREGGEGRTHWYLWPLVVPPIYDKTRITGMSVLEHQESAARRAIRTADRILVLGYSLPPADVAAAQMLRRAFERNTQLQVLDCVNPDPAIVPALKSRLECRAIRFFGSAEAFLDLG